MLGFLEWLQDLATFQAECVAAASLPPLHMTVNKAPNSEKACHVPTRGEDADIHRCVNEYG